MEDKLDALVQAALQVREQAYAPYSGFLVGAAIVDENGNIHVGANVENASFPLGSCAEGGAIGAMIAAGGRKIVTIVIVGGRSGAEECSPCGGCRQRIAEFADDETDIVMIGPQQALTHYTIDVLLPASFAWPG